MNTIAAISDLDNDTRRSLVAALLKHINRSPASPLKQLWLSLMVDIRDADHASDLRRGA